MMMLSAIGRFTAIVGVMQYDWTANPSETAHNVLADIAQVLRPIQDLTSIQESSIWPPL
jgi:hypothetical protein